ncbi:MAG: response regulator [Candidatus Latescibacteria bacterium]|nr:response regulator [Candidatus Latescibacterota bacterium]NIO02102.1 response regulator [Candidatus Latescibacterota bacterium]
MDTAGAKVLIVDDDAPSRRLLEVRLRALECKVEIAGDGEEGLQKVDSFQPDVILLDYMMPKMTGLEVLKRLKEHEKHKAVPVILLTGKGSQEDKVMGLDAGADDYVVKPFEPFELLARVRSMLRIKQMHDAQEEWNRTLADKVKQQVDEIERMNRLKRYLSPQIAETILKEDNTNLIKSHRREITVAFLDLRGFTAFTDGAEPEEITELLDSYHAEMGKLLIFKYEGTLERFSGDGIMVFFNDPIPYDDHTNRAVQMALDMRDRVSDLRATAWNKRGYDLDLGVGIAAGYATLGNIGFEGRRDYGAIGKVTNLAARLSDEAKGGQVLTDQKTLGKIDDFIESEAMGEFQLKGFLRPVVAYNIVRLKK